MSLAHSLILLLRESFRIRILIFNNSQSSISWSSRFILGWFTNRFRLLMAKPSIIHTAEVLFGFKYLFLLYSYLMILIFNIIRGYSLELDYLIFVLGWSGLVLMLLKFLIRTIFLMKGFARNNWGPFIWWISRAR